MIFDGVWGHFKLFIKCGGVGNVLLVEKKEMVLYINIFVFNACVFSIAWKCICTCVLLKMQ